MKTVVQTLWPAESHKRSDITGYKIETMTRIILILWHSSIINIVRGYNTCRGQECSLPKLNCVHYVIQLTMTNSGIKLSGLSCHLNAWMPTQSHEDRSNVSGDMGDKKFAMLLGNWIVLDSMLASGKL